MIRRQPVFAVVALLLLPAWSWAADEPGIPAWQAAQRRIAARRPLDAHRTATRCFSREAGALLGVGRCRFGGWAFWHSGSPAKVGEYQDLRPSPFFDVDGFSSDGTRTLGITATGTDQETTLGRLYYLPAGRDGQGRLRAFPAPARPRSARQHARPRRSPTHSPRPARPEDHQGRSQRRPRLRDPRPGTQGLRSNGSRPTT